MQGMEALLGKDQHEGPRAGLSQEPSSDPGETHHLVGLRDERVPLLTSGN